MGERFVVRKTDQGGHGVWDNRLKGWRSELDLWEKSARGIAEQMNTAEAERSRSPRRETRRVDPPRPVLIKIDGKWWTGTLDMWAREPDGWFGRAVLDDNPVVNWYPAQSLRPSVRNTTPHH